MTCPTGNGLQFLDELGRLLSRFVEENWSVYMTEQVGHSVMRAVTFQILGCEDD